MPTSKPLGTVLAATVILSALGAAFPLQKFVGRSSPVGFPGTPLACLDKSTVQTIRHDPSNLATAYSACRDELSQRLSNFHLDEWGLKAAFAALAAHAMAPYGNSEELQLQELLRERQLDCDNYAALTGHFVAILLPDHPTTFAVVGLQSKKIGNHAQVFLKVAEHHHILADPTLGIIADTGYNALFSGRAVPPEKVEAFYAYADPDIIAFGSKVYAAIVDGGYRPFDALYFFSDMKSFVRWGDTVQPIFDQKPVDGDKLAIVLPTPGGSRLKRALGADAIRSSEGAKQ